MKSPKALICQKINEHWSSMWAKSLLQKGLVLQPNPIAMKCVAICLNGKSVTNVQAI